MKTTLRLTLFAITAFVFGNSAIADDWWNMSDQDFVVQYGKLATGSQSDQSEFAWMMFARVNQRAVLDGREYSKWELWPSDFDTFSPNTHLFDAAKKVRTRPHLQDPGLVGLLKPSTIHGLLQPLPPSGGGEEVTRNDISYNYITGKGLNTSAGIAKYLGSPGAKIDFPVATVEIKAEWVTGTLDGAYQITDPTTDASYSLTGLHIMIKVAPRPDKPFTDPAPSWFWTTFEFKNNRGLAAAQKFITYHDASPSGYNAQQLSAAGLGSTPFSNYVCNGVQIQFSDAKNKEIVLGNTQMEWFLATPQNQNPVSWKSWSTSCHSCHAQASGDPAPFQFTEPVGPLNGSDLPGAKYQSFDFVWALFRAR